MNNLHLDISRYAFNYLYDLREDYLSIKFFSIEEFDFYHKLVEVIPSKSFVPSPLTIFDINGDFDTADYKGGRVLTFREFLNVLFRYAGRDDKQIMFQTEKKLFKESLNSRLKELKIK